MQFNSYIFILVYLPLFVICYYAVSKIGCIWKKIFIVVSGAVFYYLGDSKSILVLGLSILVNYLACLLIRLKQKTLFLALPIVINVMLLFGFKYLNFGIDVVNRLRGGWNRGDKYLSTTRH